MFRPAHLLVAGSMLVAGLALTPSAPAAASSVVSADQSSTDDGKLTGTCARGTCTKTFTAGGTWSEPATGTVTVSAAGGRGGQGGSGENGGTGQSLTLQFQATAGTIPHLSFSVGGAGGDGGDSAGGAGGVGGGGAGGSVTDGYTGGGGGGATRVSLDGTLRLVAGGGGGGGGGADESTAFDDENATDVQTNVAPGGNAGLDGAGAAGAHPNSSPCSQPAGGAAVSSSHGAGGGAGTVQTGGNSLGKPGDSGAGGGGAGGGQGGCGWKGTRTGGSGTAGQGGAGAGGGSGANCSGLACLTNVQSSPGGGGGGGGGQFGGGGGGNGYGYAGGGGGGGSSYLGDGVSTNTAGARGAGYVTVSWSYPAPTVNVVSVRQPTSPGQEVNVAVDLVGRQRGSGSAGTVQIVEPGNNLPSVRRCATPQDAKNSAQLVFCSVAATTTTTYAVIYRPGDPYAGGVQYAYFTVTLPNDTSTTVLTAHGTFAEGSSIDLGVSVSGTRIAPTGTVTFAFGDGNGHWSPESMPLALTARAGQPLIADFDVQTPLPTQVKQLRATYSGAAGLDGSSSTIPIEIQPRRVDLSLSRPLIVAGDPVTLSAQAPACTGMTIDFQSVKDDGTVLQTFGPYAANGDGLATVTLDPTAGTYTYIANVHSSCGANGAVSAKQYLTVQGAKTTLDLDVDPNLRGGQTQVSATVVPENHGSFPDGSVTFSVDTGDGVAHNRSVDLSGGKVTTYFTDLPAGRYPVTATYSGSGSYSASTDTGWTDVYRLSTALTLSAPAFVPQGSTDKTVVATVVHGTTPVSTGSVDITTSAGLQTVPLDDNGQGTLTLPSTGEIGSTQSIAAAYRGADDLEPSDTTTSYTIDPPATHTIVTPHGAAVTGGTVSLGAIVTADAVTSMQGRFVVSEGGSQKADVASTASIVRPGTAFATASFAAPSTSGNHTYTVAWVPSGSPQKSAASSTSAVVNVLRAVSLAPGNASYSVVAGDPVTIPVSVSDSSGAVTGGTLYLEDGTTELGSVAVGDHPSFTFTPDWTGSTHQLKVVYSGDGTHEAKAADVAVATTQVATTVTETVTANGDTVAPGGSVPPSTPVTVGVSVGTAGAEVPTGTVTLTATGKDPVTLTLDGGTATTTLTGLSAGQVDVGLAYAGPRRFAASTVTQRFKVLATQGLSFTSTPPSPARSTDTYSVTTSAPGAGGAVSLTASGCTVAGSVVTFGDPGTCTVTATRAADDDHAEVTATQVITVVRHPQTVGLSSTPPTSAYPGDHYTLVPSPSTPGTTPSYAAGPAGVCSLDGLQVSFLHPGTCTVTADRAENTQYSAATQATQQITVSKIAQTVTIVSTEPTGDAAVVGNTFVVHATGTGPEGNAIGVAAGPDTTHGACTVDGTKVILRHPGLCQVVATQASSTDYVAGADSHSVTVSAAKTGLSTPTVDASSVSATVSVVGPGAGTPTGQVEFSVGGTPVGRADVGPDGVARLAYVVPTGAARTVAATYLGDDDFLASSGSLTRTDPTLTATLSSARPRSASGWFRGPVTVTFHCVTNGAALVGGCPGPVTLPHEGAGQSATATVTAVDGGATTLTQSGIDIDTTAPKAVVSGVRDGASYFGAAPTPRCTAVDDLSGGETCVVRTSRAGDSVSYVATATDRAGNSGVSVGSYQVTRTAIGGVDPGDDGVYTLRRGQKYVFVALTRGAAAPILVAPGAKKPGDDLGAMRQVTDLAGLNRWTRVWKASAPRGNRVRVMGIRFGSTTEVIRVRFVG